MTEFKTLLCAEANGVGIVTIQRPEKLNAINAEVIAELSDAFRVLAAQGVRAAVLCGAGDKAFVAGADIAEMAEMTPAEAEAFARRGHALGEQLAALSFPVIACVNGFALGGGCELALACDLIYASEKAKLGQPEVNLGVMPGFGGTQRLARRVGIGRARELCYTADVIGAEEAKRIGLVNAVLPAAELLPKVREVAAKIASKGRLAVAQCKRVLFSGADVPVDVANALETQAFAQLFGTLDQREGMKAFLEKRTPAFTGK